MRVLQQWRVHHRLQAARSRTRLLQAERRQAPRLRVKPHIDQRLRCLFQDLLLRCHTLVKCAGAHLPGDALLLTALCQCKQQTTGDGRRVQVLRAG